MDASRSFLKSFSVLPARGPSYRVLQNLNRGVRTPHSFSRRSFHHCCLTRRRSPRLPSQRHRNELLCCLLVD